MPNDTGATPEPDDPTKYKRLAATIRKEISDGTYERGKPVPTITELTRDLGWARQTCARALALLAGEGLLTRYDGLGYHVSQRPPKK
jgi:GntR family transcriptional regulator